MPKRITRTNIVDRTINGHLLESFNFDVDCFNELDEMVPSWCKAQLVKPMSPRKLYRHAEVSWRNEMESLDSKFYG